MIVKPPRQKNYSIDFNAGKRAMPVFFNSKKTQDSSSNVVGQANIG